MHEGSLVVAGQILEYVVYLVFWSAAALVLCVLAVWLSRPPREKRTRSHCVESSSTGCLQISDVDPDGHFVQIKNCSNQVESLGGFKIVHKSEGEDDLVFRFLHESNLQGGTFITIWAAKAAGATHNPPGEIIGLNVDKWCFGDKTTTELVSGSGQVVATFVQRSSPSETYPTFKTVGSAATSSFPHVLEGGEEEEEEEEEVEKEEEEEEEAGHRYTTTTTTTRRLLQEPHQGGEEHMLH